MRLNGDRIILSELEVHYRVGVPEEERSRPQRLLLNVELQRDLRRAGATDSIQDTTNYFEVAERLKCFGEGREWRLIECCAEQAAAMLLKEFRVEGVTIEVCKFIIPGTRHVSVRITRLAPPVMPPG